MVNLLALTLLLLSAWAIGSLILPRSWFDRRVEWIVLSIAAGVAALSYGIFTLGHLGVLYRPLIWALLLLPLLIQGIRLAPRVPGTLASLRGGISLPGRDESDLWLPRIALLTALLLTALDLTEALHLDLCPDRYHVIFAKSFLNNHRIEFLPGAVISCYPMALEMLFVIGVMFEPESASSVIHTAFLPLSALALYAALGRRWGKTGASLGALWILAQMMLHKFAPMGFDDLGAAFYAAAALIPLLRFASEHRLRDAALGGALAGMAVSCRLNAALLVAAPLFGALVLAAAFSGARWRKAFLGVGVFFAASLALYSPWMIRNAIQSGSPFAPVLTDYFPLNPDFDQAVAGYNREYPIQAELLFKYPLRALRVYHDHITREGSSAAALLPLAGIGLAIYAARRRSPEAAFLCAAALLAFLAYAFAGPSRPRYAIPALPLFSAAAAAAMSLLLLLLRPRMRVLIVVIFALLAVVFVMKGVRDYRGALVHRPLLTARERHAFLKAAYPAYDRTLEVDGMLDPGDRLAVHRADFRYNHLTVPFSPVSYWGRSHAEFLWWKAQAGGPEGAVERFRSLLKQAGITHILVGVEHDIFPREALKVAKRWNDAVLYEVMSDE